MLKNDSFETFISNFRYLEATGYISALIDTGQISASRGKALDSLIRAYNRVVSNALWDKEGVLLLSLADNYPDDIEQERDRILSLIKAYRDGNQSLLLVYASAFSAMANEDRMHFDLYLNALQETIEKHGSSDAIRNAIGGYEKFYAIGSEIERLCNLNDSIMFEVKKLTLRVKLED